VKIAILILFPTLCFAAAPPTPFPIFLKSGFSSVLEFETAPTRVVLGDTQSFQVEKLNQSVIVKTLTPYATSNMFVYFKDEDPRLFVLSASEDAEPTYYKKFESPKPALPSKAPGTTTSSISLIKGARVLSAVFDSKKDYLTIEIEVSADSSQVVKPRWAWVRLHYNKAAIQPMKLWAERESIQKDSKVKARFIFAKPNVPKSLSDVSIVIPILGQVAPTTLSLQGRAR